MGLFRGILFDILGGLGEREEADLLAAVETAAESSHGYQLPVRLTVRNIDKWRTGTRCAVVVICDHG